MPDISTIEDAFIDALSPLLDEGVRSVASYADQLSRSDARRMIRRTPCVFVVWNGSSVESINQVDYYKTSVLVLVCDRDLRGQEAARRGMGPSKGVYHWLDRCRDLLHRRRILNGWTPAGLRREGALVVGDGDDGVVVYQQNYEIMTRIQA